MYFSAKLNDLVSFVIQNQAEKAIDLLKTGDFDKNVLDDIGCSEKPLPLYKLSLCNDILLNSEGWSKEYLPVVKRNRAGCKRLLEYWKNQLLYPIDAHFDFESYQAECAHFKDWDIEELLDRNINELTTLGYNEEEVELCYAVLTYKLDLIQKHIKKGTNPNVYISGSIPFGEGRIEDGESYNALEYCNTVCCDAFDCYGLKVFWSDENAQQVRVRDIHLLLEAAAYCDLEKKLKEIKQNPE